MSESVYSPLLKTLELYAATYYKPIDLDAITAALPEDHKYSNNNLLHQTDLFQRAARRAGFKCQLIVKDIDNVSNLVLPAVLVLEGGNACILEHLDFELGKAKIMDMDTAGTDHWVDIDILKTDYVGYGYLLKKQYQFQKRALELVEHKQEHWFWSTIKLCRPIYMNVLLASFFINLFVLATPLFTMNVYDRVVPNDAMETLWVFAVGVFFVYTIDTVLRFMRNYLLETAGEKADVIMSSLLFEHTLDLRMEAWPKSVGAFASTIREFDSVRNFLTSATITMLIDLPFAILFLMLVGYIGGIVVVVPLVIIALLIIYALLMVGPIQRSIESTYETNANKNSLLIESLYSILSIKTLGRSRQAQWEWEESTGDIARKSLRSRLLSGSLTVVTTFLTNMNTLGVMIVGIYAVRNQDLTLGGLIACVILGSRIIAPMAQLAGLITSYQRTKTAYDSLDQLMQSPVERPLEKTFTENPSFYGPLQFRDVVFAYPGSELATLKSVTTKIEAGEKVGVIGKIGSGKSTLANLILGLYKPQDGMLTVNGLDIQQIDPALLRRKIAYLSQDGTLFRGTIRDNILFKNPQANDDELLKAAKLGGVDLFINSLPMGVDTPVGEQGQGLSGGQRQSIALSRALLLDSPIIILDEPTSAMDNSMEQYVRGRIKEYVDDKTLLLITHKMSMLDLVDRLIVVEGGKIVLDGPKEAVLKGLQNQAIGS